MAKLANWDGGLNYELVCAGSVDGGPDHANLSPALKATAVNNKTVIYQEPHLSTHPSFHGKKISMRYMVRLSTCDCFVSACDWLMEGI